MCVYEQFSSNLRERQDNEGKGRNLNGISPFRRRSSPVFWRRLVSEVVLTQEPEVLPEGRIRAGKIGPGNRDLKSPDVRRTS